MPDDDDVDNSALTVVMKTASGGTLYYSVFDNRSIDQALLDAGLYAARQGYTRDVTVSIIHRGTDWLSDQAEAKPPKIGRMEQFNYWCARLLGISPRD